MHFNDYIKGIGTHLYKTMCDVRDTNNSYEVKIEIDGNFLTFSLIIPKVTLDIAAADRAPNWENRKLSEQLDEYLNSDIDHTLLFDEVKEKFNSVNESSSEWKHHDGDPRFLLFSGRMVLHMQPNLVLPEDTEDKETSTNGIH